jgi:hypothetical protein
MVLEQRCLAANKVPWIVEQCDLAEATGELVEAAGCRIERTPEGEVR